jgi:hypothetical protein
MIRYIVVGMVSGILFGILDGLINANSMAQRLYEVYPDLFINMRSAQGFGITVKNSFE